MTSGLMRIVFARLCDNQGAQDGADHRYLRALADRAYRDGLRELGLRGSTSEADAAWQSAQAWLAGEP